MINPSIFTDHSRRLAPYRHNLNFEASGFRHRGSIDGMVVLTAFRQLAVIENHSTDIVVYRSGVLPSNKSFSLIMILIKNNNNKQLEDGPVCEPLLLQERTAQPLLCGRSPIDNCYLCRCNNCAFFCRRIFSRRPIQAAKHVALF